MVLFWRELVENKELFWYGKQSEVINHFSCARGSLELQGVKMFIEETNHLMA